MATPIHVEFKNIAEWIRATSFTAQQVRKVVVVPAYDKLGREITESISEEFSGEMRYHGDMEESSQYSFDYEADEFILQIIETADHGKFIRNPGAGPYKGFPYPVVEWAQEKLGMDRRAAGAIAYQIMKYGVGYSPKSPLVKRLPKGKRPFDYPRLIVNVKNQKEIGDAVREIGSGIPKLMYMLGAF